VKTELEDQNKADFIEPILEVVKREIGAVSGNSLILNYSFTELYEIWEKATAEMKKMLSENEKSPKFGEYFWFILQLQVGLKEKLEKTEKMVKNVKGWVDSPKTPIL